MNIVSKKIFFELIFFFVFSTFSFGQQNFSDIFDIAVSRIDKLSHQKLYIYLHNPFKNPLIFNPEKIFINGKRVKEGRGEKGAIWYDICPNKVLPNNWAAVKILFSKKGEVGEKIKVELITEDGKSIYRQLKVISNPDLKFLSYSFNNQLNKIYLYLESDEEKNIRRVFINGKDFTSKTTIKEIVSLNNKNYFFLKITLPKPLLQGSYLIVKVEGERALNASIIRVIKPYFPIGMYYVEKRNGKIEEEHLKDCKEHLINCIHVSFRRTRAGKDIKILQKYGIKALFDPEWGSRLPSTLKKFKDDPSILAWYVADEPEIYGKGGRPMRFLQAPERRIQNFRQLGSRYPVFWTHCPWHNKYYAYAGIVDIAVLDDYPVCNAPITRVIKTMKEGMNAYSPAPIWFVLQAFNGPGYGGRYPTPEELKFMAYNVVGLGAKGILYFNYGHISEPCYGVGKPMEELDKLYEKGREKLQKDLNGIKEDARKLWKKIKEINLNLKSIKKFILKSAPIQLARTDNENVKVFSLISGSEGIVLFVINQAYKYDKKTFIPSKMKNIRVKVNFPFWFKVKNLIEVCSGKFEKRKYNKDGKGNIEFIIPEVKVGKIFLLLKTL